jgi:methionyl-tRNA formyltransferase
MKTKVFFIGNRNSAFKGLLKSELVEISNIYVEPNSYLHKHLEKSEVRFNLIESKKALINDIQTKDFDVLIANGLKYILPISSFDKQKVYLNVHPSYLPSLKGKSPLNGTFLKKMNFYGVTLHKMDDGIDTGEIIYQEKIEVTSDLDLGLLYFCMLKLEESVLKKGLEILLNKKPFSIIDNKVQDSYYSKNEVDYTINFEKDSTNVILNKIKSFGVLTQGVYFKDTNHQAFMVFDAEIVFNSFIVNTFEDKKPGEILFIYDEKLLIKTKDGILKFTKYHRLTD